MGQVNTLFCSDIIQSHKINIIQSLHSDITKSLHNDLVNLRSSPTVPLNKLCDSRHAMLILQHFLLICLDGRFVFRGTAAHTDNKTRHIVVRLKACGRWDRQLSAEPSRVKTHTASSIQWSTLHKQSNGQPFTIQWSTLHKQFNGQLFTNNPMVNP